MRRFQCRDTGESRHGADPQLCSGNPRSRYALLQSLQSADAAQTLQKLAEEHSPWAPQHSAANQQPPHLLPVSVLDFHCTTYCICLRGKEKPEFTRVRGQPHCSRLCSGSGQLRHTFVLQLQLREPLLHLRSPWLVPGVNTLA